MADLQLYKNAHERATQLLSENVPVKKILDYLTSVAEHGSGGGSVCSILVLDEEGLLRNASSPNLPDDYLLAIDGLRPNASLGTCAAAAATGSIILTPDFYADNKWAELKHLPLALGFQGAWSMPIITRDNRILGTFGTYFREKRKPTITEIEGVEILCISACEALLKQEAAMNIHVK